MGWFERAGYYYLRPCMKVTALIGVVLLPCTVVVAAIGQVKPQPPAPYQPARAASIKNIVFDLNDVLVRMGRHGVREPVAGMADIIMRLHQQGFKLYILSDSSTKFWERMRARFDFLKYFDGAVLSSAVGFAKPSVQMYTTLLTTYSLKPEECFFIDDDQSNVNGAYRVGIDGIRFVSARQLETVLQQLHILK